MNILIGRYEIIFLNYNVIKLINIRVIKFKKFSIIVNSDIALLRFSHSL